MTTDLRLAALALLLLCARRAGCGCEGGQDRRADALRSVSRG